MTGQSGYYDIFARALRARRPDAPTAFSGRNVERFSIYRNNVHRAYIDALADAYPVVARLVGDSFFEAMAKEYYLAAPQPAVSLALYGAGLADFIEDFPPAQSLPYLADVARLERAWLEAYNAADAPPLDPATLAAFGDSLPTLCFVGHPACRLLSSSHPVLSIWRANRQDSTGPATIPAVGETALVARPLWDVTVYPLTRDNACFARCLLDGHTVGDAYEAAAAQNPDFDVTAAFGWLLSAGVFTEIKQGDGP